MIDGYSPLYVSIVRLYNSCVLNPQDSFNQKHAEIIVIKGESI